MCRLGNNVLVSTKALSLFLRSKLTFVCCGDTSQRQCTTPKLDLRQPQKRHAKAPFSACESHGPVITPMLRLFRNISVNQPIVTTSRVLSPSTNLHECHHLIVLQPLSLYTELIPFRGCHSMECMPVRVSAVIIVLGRFLFCAIELAKRVSEFLKKLDFNILTFKPQ